MTAPRPPRFLTLDEILTLHWAALRQYGGLDGIRDRGSLESAVAMPSQGFGGVYAHAFPFEMAAAYAFHIAENQAFLEGNKRTALSAAITFLRLNGWSLVADQMDAADQILRFATKQQHIAGFAEWLKRHSTPRPTLELREFFSRLTMAQLTQANMTLSTAHGGTRVPEFSATAHEAASAMPFLFDLADRYKKALPNPSEVDKAEFAGMFKTYLALYRIAEDMGYEW
jgi:death-on-curing protein